MQYLIWDNWNRSGGARYWMDRTPFNGTSYTDVFYKAMRLAFADEQGRLGIVSAGQLFSIAKSDCDANGYVGFGPAELQAHLGEGKFKYGYDGLAVQGPRLAIPSDDTTFGLGEVGGRLVELNFYFLIAQVKAIIGENAAGEEALMWGTAAVMLHEIMHNQGFDHPLDVSHVSGSNYRQSFPDVAAQALLSKAPVSLVNILSLTGASGTVFENFPM